MPIPKPKKAIPEVSRKTPVIKKPETQGTRPADPDADADETPDLGFTPAMESKSKSAPAGTDAEKTAPEESESATPNTQHPASTKSSDSGERLSTLSPPAPTARPEESEKPPPPELEPELPRNMTLVKEAAMPPQETEQLPSGPTAAQIEEEYNSKFRVVIFLVTFAAAGIAMYGYYQVTQLGMARRQIVNKNLEAAVKQFPKSPLEYNMKQRVRAAAVSWRRFNFRNIAIFCSTISSSMLVAKWHRSRRLQIQKRKSIFFWAWTAAAGLLGVCGAVYLIRRNTASDIVVRAVRRNPTLRAFLYLGSIGVLGMILFAVRLRMTLHSKKRKIMREWRKRKHQEQFKMGGGPGAKPRA